MYSSCNITSAADTLIGWVIGNSSRTTIDIIQTSLITIFICTWTAIHPRIHTTVRIARWHKALVLFKMILAPELVCIESIQEWVQAKKLQQQTVLRTGGDLKLIHAFYIGMLGVRYRTESGHRVLWPRQYAWLLNNGLVTWNDRHTCGLSEDSIKDKNKADGLVKLATLWQVVWFTVLCTSRAAVGQTVAPLEVMTLAYVLVAVITYAFWWNKPKDISTVAFIDLPYMTEIQRQKFESLSMEDTYDVDDPHVKPSKNIAWYLVARDYKSDEVLQPSSVILGLRTTLHHGVATATGIEIPPEETHHENSKDVKSHTSTFDMSAGSESDIEARKEDILNESKIITQWDEALYMCRWWPLICLLGSVFGAVHLLSWSTHFPTQWELWLWRTSALASIVSSFVVMQFRAMTLEWDGPLTLLRVGSPVIYVISRIVLVVQSFAVLRLMPSSTYDTIDVWGYWFHLF